MENWLDGPIDGISLELLSHLSDSSLDGSLARQRNVVWPIREFLLACVSPIPRLIDSGVQVIGPPGAGKTTYCDGMSQFLTAAGRYSLYQRGAVSEGVDYREVAVINLDPANDHCPCVLLALLHVNHTLITGTLLPLISTI